MSGFLVDTNVLSEFSRRGDPNPNVRNWLKSVESESLYVSILTLAEIRRGIELLPPGKRREELERWLEADLIASFPGANVLPVTKNIGDRWAVLSARAQERGVHLGVIDGLIAATALEHGLTLATRNVKDFVTLAVPLVNPWETT
ncbi:MAG: type II toxin-antitoxin system VapC family toxin [Bryobacteraceae bacterium]|nr:type II toxin-antitoxin system VapC family toxin [Bryobacteraceae bacterium]